MSEEQIATKQPDNGKIEKLSIQKRVDPKATDAWPSIYWFSRREDGSDIAPWWTEQRDRDLREFYMRLGNDILQGAISSIVDKFVALSYILEGPKKAVSRYSPILAEAEFGQGWGTLLTKTLTDFFTQDKGAFWELIGAGEPNGPIIGPILGIAHLDSQFCQLTGDPTYPVVFRNAKQNSLHKLHATRVIHLVDMPSPNELFHNTGFCAVSRVIASSQVLIKIAKYKNEKLDDLPEAGLLILNNVLPQQFEDNKANYARERRRLGQEIWTNVMTLFSLDPAQPASAELISFSNLPDHFDEIASVDLYAKIVALAFGVDVREFWPLSSGSLGTATETQVMHQKAKGKGIGKVISTLERAINWKVLPSSIEFKFDFQDDEEDLLRAQIEDTKTTTIMKMWDPISQPITPEEIRQMLADNVTYFSEDFLEVDITDDITQTDMETEKAHGPIGTLDSLGKWRPARRKTKAIKSEVNMALSLAKENYRKGLITVEQIAEYALAELADVGND
jgi:hypothetical protein